MTQSSQSDKSFTQHADQLYQIACNHYNNNNFAEAEKHFKQLIIIQKTHPEANYTLGLIALHKKQASASLHFFETALDSDPSNGSCWLAYIDALDQSGQTDIARNTLEIAQLAGLDGETCASLVNRLEARQHNIANNDRHDVRPDIETTTSDDHTVLLPTQEKIDAIISLYQANSFEKCVALIQEVLSTHQNHGFSWKVLGAIFKQQGHLQEAIGAMEKAVSLLPDDPEVLNNLGLTQKDLGNLSDSEKTLRQALKINDEFAEAHNSLGITLMAQGKLEESKKCFHRAIQLQPQSVEAYCNLGTNQKNKGLYTNAEKYFRHALTLNPLYAECLNNLGNLFQGTNKLSEAETVLRKAIEIKPDFAIAYNNLGNVLQGQGHLEESVQCYSKALEIKPDYSEAFNGLLFASNYHADKDSDTIFELYREYDRRFGIPYQKQWKPHANSRNVNRRLKIGYVSPAFYNHPVFNFLEPLLARHNKEKFELFAYAEGIREDEITLRCKTYFDHWIPTIGLSDDELSKRIRDDNIDILVDLAGHTSQNRLGVFARKPAPVSLHWLDFGYTTGLSAIDYYLTDISAGPIGSEDLFSEQLWRLPVPPFTYRPSTNMGAPGPLPAKKNTYITFGTLTRAIRLNDLTIQTWAQILRQVEGSKLIINSNNFKDSVTQDSIKEKFSVHGIDSDRLEIGYDSPPWDVLRKIDICLDCFPHNSGTTLFESLYMGIPFITLAGRPGVGRLGSSILGGINHSEWVAYNREEYIEKAISLASDTEELASLRKSLRRAMENSPLMDDAGFTQVVEHAYLEMIKKWADTPDPVYPAATKIFDKGVEFQQKNHLKNAQNAYIEAINLQNNFVDAYNNLGVVFQQAGQLEDAIHCFNKVLQFRPDSFDALFNLANTYKIQKKLFKAETYYKKALDIRPDHADAHYYLGSILQDQGRPEEGEIALRKALEIEPNHIKAFSTLLFALNYHPDKLSEDIFTAYEVFNERFCIPLHQSWSEHINDTNKQRRLKIGYVAPSYRKHPARFFVEPLLAHHDSTAVETYAYVELQADGAENDLFNKYVDHFRPVAGMTDIALAEAIRADVIDILVDLSGHTAGNRLQVFAMRPAPVSLHWLDFGYTTGLSAIDYYLTDIISVPEDSEHLFSEKPWQIETPALAYRPPKVAGEVNLLPALKNNYITFGTLTRAVRINHRTIRVWSGILHQCDGAKLIINSSSFKESAMQDALAEKFKQHGISRERLEIGFHSPPWDVLKKMDIMLDCFPHNSGTTLFESLYMGVPYITLADRPSVGRLGSSILTGLGHLEWIAATEEEYINSALSLATDHEKLSGIRMYLRKEMISSPLMDEKGFTRKVETAYRKMFNQWSENPQSLQQKHTVGKKRNTTKKIFKKPPVAEIKKLTRFFDSGKQIKAIKLAQSLTHRFPQHGFAWKVLGPLLFQQGKREEAIFAMKQAVRYLPEDSDTHYNLGIALQQSNLQDKAVLSYKNAININRGHIGARFNLANIFKEQGLLEEARQNYSQILAIQPQHFEVLCNLGNVLREQEKYDESINFYQNALKQKPDSAALFNNLSLAFKEKGQLDQAESACLKALELQPELPEANNNLGRIYHEQGKLTEAEISYRKALQYKNDYTAASCNLGLTLQKQGKLTEAEHIYKQALNCDQNSSKLYQNLGLTQIRKGQLTEAEKTLRTAIQLQPDNLETYSNLLFLMNNHPDKSAEEIFEDYKKVNARFFLSLQTEWKPFTNNHQLDRRLKVGYVSYNFRKHSTRHFLEPLLEHHDKEAVEIYLYTDLVAGDEVTNRYKSYADHWIQTTGSTNQELAERIRTDGIDILIDLAGHTEKNRLGVFACKPAPVSAHWLDFGYTTGLTAIDYYLTDTINVPAQCENIFSEFPWRMQPPGLVYRPAENMGDVGNLPALHRGYITFGTFTRTLRINHRIISVWAEILKRVKNAHLIIDSSDFNDPIMQEEMIQTFTSLGIDRERLEIGFHSPPWDLFRGIDIGLDCFPHNSGTTLFETLYMGSPFVTLADRPSVGRLGCSILESIGHPEWIATTEEEYVQIAVDLAGNPEKLQSLRKTQRKTMEDSPLMAEKDFALKIESAYREMFRLWAKQDNDQQEQSRSSLIANALQQAMACRQTGLIREAIDLYNSVVEIDPDNHQAYFNLGLITLEQQTPSAALPFFENAVNTCPEHGPYWLAYIDTLVEDQQYEIAGQLLEKAILAGLEGKETEDLTARLAYKLADMPLAQRNSTQHIPRHVAEPDQKKINRLISLFKKGEYGQCEQFARSLQKQFQENGFITKALGLSLKMQNRFEEAISTLHCALKMTPEDREITHNLGDIFHTIQEFNDAKIWYQKSLESNPAIAETHFGLANSLVELGDAELAEKHFLSALQLNDDYAEAYFNLGHLYQRQMRLEESRQQYQQAIASKPDFFKAYSNLGIIMQMQGDLDGAANCYKKATHINPNFTDSLINIGACLKDQGKYTEAEKSYRKALKIYPDHALCHSNLGSVLKDQGKLQEAEKELRYALELDPNSREIHSNLLFLLNYHPDKSGEEIYEEYTAFNTRFGEPNHDQWQPHQNSCQSGRRLKIGYVSPQFKLHSIRHFFEPLVAHHDHTTLEIFAYAEMTNEDSVTSRYRSYVDHWRTTVGMNDKALAQQIRDDRIDILVDLAGHTAHNRLGMFALKPAPVSLHWLDFGYTTGLTAIDYYLTDEATVPAGNDHLFSETLLKINTPALVYRPAGGMGEVNDLPAQKCGYITFGLLTRAVRINHRTIKIWSEILKRVPESRLIIDSNNFRNSSMQETFLNKFLDHGIEKERLTFCYHTPPWDILRSFDISLDCFPHNSGTTLFETLYMGIPFITLTDRPSVGRLGCSILEGLGHPEWIAESENEYIEIAVKLATNTSELARLRSSLRQEMKNSALMDEKQFTSNVETAYQHIFQKWCEGQL